MNNAVLDILRDVHMDNPSIYIKRIIVGYDRHPKMLQEAVRDIILDHLKEYVDTLRLTPQMADKRYLYAIADALEELK
jgi:hypothetical protein